MKEQNSTWKLFFSELLGTALLLLIGLSLVIFMFGDGSSAAQLLPSYKLRQAITGFLFGGTGALIALSAIGKINDISKQYRLYQIQDVNYPLIKHSHESNYCRWRSRWCLMRSTTPQTG